MFARESTIFNCRGFFSSDGFVACLVLTVCPLTYCKTLNRYSEIHRHPFTRDFQNFSFSPEFSTSKTDSDIQPKFLKHWFKNWHALRRNKLTASTFGGAIGFWPRRRAQLWQEKIGAIEPFSGNLATFWSNIKEEEALAKYKLITGNTVTFPEFQLYGKKSPEDDWLAASPDGVVDQVFYGLPSSGVLEIKCPFFDGDKHRSYPWSRIPLYSIPQAQGLMEILDRDWMDFYVWTLNGSSLFRIHRDREYWDLMKIALSDFWWNHVQPGKEMCSKYPITNPFIQMRSLRPSPKHELCSAIVYASKCVVDDSKLLIREIHGKLQTDASWDFPSPGFGVSEESRILKMVGNDAGWGL